VPESLHALIAARLDALDPADRSLLQDGAVLGQTFPVTALSALNGEAPQVLEARLRALARREMVMLDTDPRSPERGQWGFTQALIREVAYATLSKKDRRVRHLAAARHFESMGDEEVGVLATHYVDAYLASPPGPEAESVATQARIALRAAADRASALGSHDQAVAYITRAMEVTPERADQADLLERVGNEQWLGGRLADSAATYARAADAYRDAGDDLGAVRATVARGGAYASRFDHHAAVETLESVAEEVARVGDATLRVRFEAQLGRAYMFADQTQLSLQAIERALIEAESLGLIHEIADALVTKGVLFTNLGRIREAIGLLETGDRLAKTIGNVTIQTRAAVNLTATLTAIDPRAAVEVAQQASETSRRLGLRHSMVILVGNGGEAAVVTGDVSWAMPAIDELLAAQLDASTRGALLSIAIPVHVLLGREYQGDLDDLAAIVAGGLSGPEPSLLIGRMWVAFCTGDLAAVGEFARGVAAVSLGNAPGSFALAARAAVLDGRADHVRSALDGLAATGVRGPTIDGQRSVAEAGLLALEGRWTEASPLLSASIRAASDSGLLFDLTLAWLAVLAVAPPGEILAERAETEARALIEQTGFIALRPLLDRLVNQRGSANTSPATAARTTTSKTPA
jgi:tetratricopeptide (TPR) repeat protein